MVLCTSHSTFFVSGFCAFDCSFSPSPNPPSAFLSHAEELDIALVLHNAS